MRPLAGEERLSCQHFKSGAGRGLRWRPDKVTRQKVPGEALATARCTVCGLGSYCCPPVGRKDDDGDVSPGEVLLKDKVLVAGDKALETGRPAIARSRCWPSPSRSRF